MKESDYIDATNLAKLRIAREVLRDTLGVGLKGMLSELGILIGKLERKIEDESKLRVAKASRTQTRRLKWISARAADALGVGPDWRDVQYPKGAKSEIAKLQITVADLQRQLAEREWISVEDRLPDAGMSQVIGGLFLAVNSGNVQPMNFIWKSQRWQSTPSGYDLTRQVTHWMPLPLPPIQETADE